jgi:two-component system chemotaxis sensor kinase CheA
MSLQSPQPPRAPKAPTAPKPRARKPAAESVAPVAAVATPVLPTIEDVAAMLMAAEATDRDEMRRLRDTLRAVPVDVTPGLKPYVALASILLDELAIGCHDDPLAALSEVQALLERVRGGEPTAPTRAASAASAAPPPVELSPRDGPPVAEPLAADADLALVGEFVAESRESLASAEAMLLSLETDPENMESINTVFRAFHTVKGTSAFLGLSLITDFAHHAETLLSRMRDREVLCAGGYADLALRSVDMIKLLVDGVDGALAGGVMAAPHDYHPLMEALADPEAAGVTAAAAALPEETNAVPRLGDILVGLGANREAIEAALQSKGDQPAGLAIVHAGAASLTDVAQALRKQQQLAGVARANSGDDSIRVRVDRLDRLVDLVGELVIAQAMLTQDPTVVDSTHQELSRKVVHAGKIVRELQDLTMATRMVPLKPTFQKLARLVRDVAQKTGKQVEFSVQGEDTEIDRTMVDAISDPLVHMARNAVDHGIESPEGRRAAGKPVAGQVRLRAYHASGNVVVELTDDGRGVDRDRLVQKAIDRGLITSSTGMSDNDVLNLIFAAGLSTAETITDISGRGVGMDVVRRGVESLRGRVDISSELGHGSTFMVCLPLTMAITDGMLVRVGAERYVIPLASIVLSFRPEAGSMRTVAGRGELAVLRDELLPVIRLHRLFAIPDAIEDPTAALLMVVGTGERRCALLVDELLGQQQVVAKSLGRGMGRVPGVSGGAILGDGRVGLILDVPEIETMARRAP